MIDTDPYLHDLDLLDEDPDHASCRRCWPSVKPYDTYVALCGKRTLAVPVPSDYPDGYPDCIECVRVIQSGSCPVCGYH